MAKAAFRIVKDTQNDRAEYYYGEAYIGSANHEAHGWAGLELMDDMVKRLAQVLHTKVTVDDG